MNEFKSLIDILERLLAPDGCPWDREQTLHSMRHALVEETYEVIEAIDLDDDRQIEEELGDLLFVVVFLCLLAGKEGRFTLQDALRHVAAKLVRRHPHIFGEVKLKTSQEVLKQWGEIKQIEKKGHRKNALDGIPKDLPSLARAQKMAKEFARKHFVPQERKETFSPEEQAGESLWQAVQEMAEQGIQAEQALRKRLAQIEAEFRHWEQQKQE